MKTLRRFCFALVLIVAFTMTALAGDISVPVGGAENPGDAHTPGLANTDPGDAHTPGLTNSSSFINVEDLDMSRLDAFLFLIQSVL